ncbi:MAG: response regulator [Deltaproteobacteria bacterium]|nr:response regulator [Deltaproteobacteria bacterium]
MRALVIDDSRAARMAVSRILKSIGFDVVEAENGEQALDILNKDETITVAMVDWNMPIMNGYEFVKLVRRSDKFREVMLVMVTTENEMSQVVKALSAGANEYVMKPFTDEVILEKLEMLGLRL